MKHRGTISLVTKGGLIKSKALYTDAEERSAVIDCWRLLYRDRMRGWWMQIFPYFDIANENKWSRRL